jgi:PAS domain S-box-containing protein
VSSKQANPGDLLQDESTFSAIFHATLESIIVADEDGKIVLANPQSSKMFGYASESLVGLTVESLIPKSKRKQHKVHRNAYHNDPQPRQMGAGRDLYGLSKDGSVFPIEISLTPTTIENKHVVIAFVIDISERKKMQEALQLSEEQLIKYAAQLEKRVEERTKKLAETVGKLEQEIKDRKKAQKETKIALEREKELNSLKSRFVSMASHEFRTPLSTVLSSASLIAQYSKRGDEEKTEKHISRIKSKVGELTDILNDFLSLDKLEQGKIDYQPEEIELVGFIQLRCEELKTVAKAGQTLCFEPTQAQCVLNIDPKVILHILTNLCSNAIKYSPDDSQIDIVLTESEKTVSMAISDQGIGIPESDQKHMFERFFRANNATNIQGTGLGLNLVKRYAELAKGQISFQSEEGKGSIFKVEFPKVTSS